MNYKDIARLFTLSILFLLLSCHREKGGEDQALETISVDLNMRNHVYSSELFADIQVIPLETTPESLIRQITQIKYFEERFYIHDYSRSCLLVFDSKGHFLFALNEKGNAPGQYLNLTDFEIDKIHKNIVILCAVSNSLYFYDLEGKFIKNQKLPNIIGAYNSFQFQNEDTIAFFTYDYNSRLKFYSLSEGKIFREEYPEDRKDIFCRGVFPFPNAFRRALIGTVYFLSDACISELYRWDFGDLNNDLAQLDFRPNMNRQEQIQYVRDAYSSKSVNYVIDQQGQNSRYRYAMVVRKDKYLHLFYDRRKNVLLQFEHTQEGLGLFPIYFGEEFMLCTPEGGLPVDELFPEKLRNEEQQRMIQSLSDEENPILIQYDFKKMKINENTISVFLLGILIGIVFVRYVNYFKKPIQDIDIDNFEYEKESLYTIKREELKNNYYQCLDQKVYWGTDSLQTSTLRELCSDEKLFFCFSETACPPCIETVIDMLNGAFSKEEIDKRVIFVSPDYPIRLRNDCYGRKLLNLQNKIFGLPLERQESFPPFLFVLDNKLRVKYLHIYNKVFPQLTSIYLEEIKFSD